MYYLESGTQAEPIRPSLSFLYLHYSPFRNQSSDISLGGSCVGASSSLNFKKCICLELMVAPDIPPYSAVVSCLPPAIRKAHKHRSHPRCRCGDTQSNIPYIGSIQYLELYLDVYGRSPQEGILSNISPIQS